MACPLNAILNPIDPSPQTNPLAATGDDDKDATTSETSTEIIDECMADEDIAGETTLGFDPPSEHQRSRSDTEQGITSPVILSPVKDSWNDRRSSFSPISIPLLPSSPRRSPSPYPISDPPPPSSHESKSRRFSVFNALLEYPELTLEFSKQLDVEDLISLYAISKEFHFLVNARFTAMILGQSNGKASESSKTFIFRCYKSLCMRDPARRLNDTKPDELRFIPSFRWLRMILFREAVVDDILQSLAAEGHRMPKRTRLTIKKIFWSDKDIFLATMFFLKLDMRLTHPTAGNGEIGLRKMLLGQRSLSTLAKVLRREEMKTQVDMLRMIVRYNYEPRRYRQMDIMGVPSHEIGKLQYEGWGAKNTKFIRIDELVMREAVKRKLNLQNYYVDMMIYGYVNKKTFQDIRTPMATKENEVGENSGDNASSDEDEETIEGGSARETEADGYGGAKENGDDVENGYHGNSMPRTGRGGRFHGYLGTE